MKSFKIKKALILLLLFFAFGLFSQTVIPPNELDAKYTPNASSMFNNLVKKQGEYFKDEVEIKTIIKFYPTTLIRQKIHFF